MPLPKQRHSHTRGKKRRTHWKVIPAGLIACPQCKSLKRPHRVCPVCGNYDGKQAVAIKVKKDKKKAA
ncbi:MAG: 50S ribosomal protein L32 [Candidatus Omnitrophica bacterium]|nr:50S ribosomal protein L32 [Candidatus Omnitrophota bacterium]MDD5078848.1 50S ribosomal protein L32 [Candidatus Omnitrophota bacterium]